MGKTTLFSTGWIVVITFTVMLGLGVAVTPVGAQNKEELVFQKGLGRIDNGFIIIPGAEELKADETGKFDLMMENEDGTVKDVKVVGGCGL